MWYVSGRCLMWCVDGCLAQIDIVHTAKVIRKQIEICLIFENSKSPKNNQICLADDRIHVGWQSFY